MALLQQSDLVYQGAFKLPDGGGATGSTDGFDYGAMAMAYNVANDSLFISGHVNEKKIAEVSIPTILNVPLVSNLNIASYIQNFVEPTEGGINTDGGTDYGGMLVLGSTLLLTRFHSYDGLGAQVAGHYKRPVNLSTTGQVGGPYTLRNNGDTGQKAAMFAGWLATVPAAHQAAVGGPLFTGNGSTSILSATSFGPSFFAFDNADLGVANPVIVTPWLYYPQAHQTLGDWQATSNIWNGSAFHRGAVFPTGYDSVLFIGKHGTGPYCYGDSSCGDPTNGSQGNHAYPYRYQIWHYSILDLLAATNPWDVVPDVWPFDLPYVDVIGSPGVDSHLLGGAAYDPATQRIFIAQAYGHAQVRPIIHVFQISGTPPSEEATLTATPAIQKAGQSCTVTWSGVAAPTTTDYIAMFDVSGLNTPQIDRFYLNGTKSAPVSGSASGNFAFPIPRHLRNGTYNFRLFTEDTQTVLATSGNVIVQARKVKGVRG